MQNGFQLNELAREILRQTEAKVDYITPTLKHLETLVDFEGSEVRLKVKDKALPINDYAHGQLAARLNIPKKYYDRMQTDAPELLATNLNTWLSRGNGHGAMVRTMDGRVRAFLSDSFRPMDNDMVVNAALPAMKAANLELVSNNLSERRLYVQAVSPRLQGEVKPGDIVQAGITLTNSEVGAGALALSQTVWRLVCSNGLITDKTLRKAHLGGKLNGNAGGDDGIGTFKADTMEASNRALMLQIRDTVENALKDEPFQEQLHKLQTAAGRVSNRTIPEITEVTQKFVGLTDGEGNSFLTHLAQGGDLSAWGVTNALTRMAQDVEADRAFDLEQLANDVIELSASKWNELYMRG